MSYYPEPDSHIIDKVKVVLDLTNYPTKKIEYATDVDLSDLAAKEHFVAFKSEVDKLVNVLTSINN